MPLTDKEFDPGFNRPPENLAILYEDPHLVVVNKPPDCPTQGRAPESVESFLRRRENPERPDRVYLGAVHRLDRPVSGVLVWAKTSRDARRLSEQFASRRICKEYWAIVEAPPEGVAGVWDDWLCTEETGLGAVQVCRAGTPRSRRAITRWRLGASAAGRTLLILTPETGRTHQLRVQAGSRGLPIVGDHRYGSRLSWPLGIALHARGIRLEHPATHQPLSITAEPPIGWTMAGVLAEGGTRG